MNMNCDIGERGVDHPVDLALMPWIDMANIACGGHAGDEQSVEAFRALAATHQVNITAHLSYPDRERFGRCRITMDTLELLKALDAQRAMMPDVSIVKFHGALYNDSAADRELADVLAAWCTSSGIETLLTPADSAMAEAAVEAGVAVMAEAFADRRYCWSVEEQRLALVDRNNPDACIERLEDALAQCRMIVEDGTVTVEGNGTVRTIRAETLCVHSDSAIALPLVEALAKRRW